MSLVLCALKGSAHAKGANKSGPNCLRCQILCYIRPAGKGNDSIMHFIQAGTSTPSLYPHYSLFIIPLFSLHSLWITQGQLSHEFPLWLEAD